VNLAEHAENTTCPVLANPKISGRTHLLGLLAGFRVAVHLRRGASWAERGMSAVTGAETDALFQTANAKRLSPEISGAFCCPSNLRSG